MKQQGKLISWNDEKGFGFIKPASGGPQVFVHISSFPRGQRRPVVNESLTYSVTRNRGNRVRAENVRYRRAAKRGVERPRGVFPALCLLAGFFAFLTWFALAGYISFPVVGFYALISAATFAIYGLDKSAARRGAWRTAEARLHFAEILGGWPGALVAQRVFRHKTNKKPFQVVFWAAAVANCAALLWLSLSEAAADLRMSLGL